MGFGEKGTENDYRIAYQVKNINPPLDWRR
jgi:hypothetical protein